MRFHVPEFRHDCRSTSAQTARPNRCLICPSSIPWFRLRLALLSLLGGVEEAEFTWLRAKTEATDGNLGAQLLKLEDAGYVAVKMKFVSRKPQTLYRITETGRRALTEYIQAQTVAWR